MSFLIWCSVPTVTALSNHTTFAKNRAAQLVPRSIRRRQKTDDHSDAWAGKVILQKKHCMQAPWNTWEKYPDSGCYVYEQDTSLLGPLGFFSWRRVNSLGSHSLFLGLNYPINQEITVGKDLDGREAQIAMENCVYMTSPRSLGANSPNCQRYSLHPKEGENDKGIWIHFDPWMSQLRQAVMWFKPSGW